MNTASDDIKERLRFKTVSTILIGVISTILFGILLYLLPIFILDATLGVILLLFFAISLSSGYFLKTPKLFYVNIFIVVLSPLITFFLNSIYPKYAFTDLTSSLVSDAFLLFIFSLFVSVLLITPIIRICSGYETYYDPVVYSYVTAAEADDDFRKRLKKLIELVGATAITPFISKDPNFTTLEFLFMKDKYLAYLRPRGNNITELDFLSFRLKRDTIISPERDDVDLFLSLFDAAAGKWDEQRKIARIGKEKTPVFLQETKSLFVLSYASPVRLPITIPRPRASAIRTWADKHTVLIGFIGGIVATIIGALILRYIFGI